MVESDRVKNARDRYLRLIGTGKRCLEYKVREELDTPRTAILMEYARAIREDNNADVLFSVIQAAYKLGVSDYKRHAEIMKKFSTK